MGSFVVFRYVDQLSRSLHVEYKHWGIDVQCQVSITRTHFVTTRLKAEIFVWFLKKKSRCHCMWQLKWRREWRRWAERRCLFHQPMTMWVLQFTELDTSHDAPLTGLTLSNGALLVFSRRQHSTRGDCPLACIGGVRDWTPWKGLKVTNKNKSNSVKATVVLQLHCNSYECDELFNKVI